MSLPLPAPDHSSKKAPVNLPATILFSVSTGLLLSVFPVYAWFFDFSAAAWWLFVALLFASGLSITGGYHRLWSHRAYEARLPLRVFYMLFGAMALQNSILIWSSMHRVHHKNVDDIEHDPYSIKRGFWFAHMGWMLRDYSSQKIDFSNVQDLERDPVVMFQHRHYLTIALLMNIALPAVLGLALGDVWSVLLVAGLLRLVVNHHFTFFINSLAHMWGRRPYTESNSARDNDLIALFTYGEGYHNFHHLFSWDYRNGVRWWQIDLTKWWIALWSWLGLAHGLRRVPEFKIRRAMVERQIASTEECLASAPICASVEAARKLLEQESEALRKTVNEWTRLQTEKIEAARQQVIGKVTERWEQSEARKNLQALEISLLEQYKRLRQMQLQSAAAFGA